MEQVNYEHDFQKKQVWKRLTVDTKRPTELTETTIAEQDTDWSILENLWCWAPFWIL